MATQHYLRRLPREINMKSIFGRVYWFILGPVYRRLSRDVSLRLQELLRVQVEFQEKWLVRVSDELVVMSLRAIPYLNRGESKYADRNLYDVIDIVGRIHSTGDLVQLSEKLSIPLDELCYLYIKYGDVNRAGIARILELEKQIKQLSAFVSVAKNQSELDAGGNCSREHPKGHTQVPECLLATLHRDGAIDEALNGVDN